MWNKLRNEPVNKTGYIKRIIAYGIDWYLGSVLSSLPLIIKKTIRYAYGPKKLSEMVRKKPPMI